MQLAPHILNQRFEWQDREDLPRRRSAFQALIGCSCDRLSQDAKSLEITEVQQFVEFRCAEVRIVLGRSSDVKNQR